MSTAFNFIKKKQKKKQKKKNTSLVYKILTGYVLEISNGFFLV